MNIELVNVEGEPQAAHIKRLDLKLILCAAKIQLDKQAEAAVDFSDWNKDIEDLDDYADILDRLEGYTTDLRIAIRVRDECLRLRVWVDSFLDLPIEEAQ